MRPQSMSAAIANEKVIGTDWAGKSLPVRPVRMICGWVAVTPMAVVSPGVIVTGVVAGAGADADADEAAEDAELGAANAAVEFAKTPADVAAGLLTDTSWSDAPVLTM